MESPLLLGIDVGTSRTKAVLVDGDGREAGVFTATTPFATRDGRVEMPVDDLLDCLAAVLGEVGDPRARVAAAGLAGMAESGAPLDRSGRALAPVIAWHDERGQQAVDALERHFGPDLALRIGQPVRTVLTATKLGWLVEHGMAGAVRWLGVPELGLHALTDAEATEFSLAARTGCYDVATRGWMPDVGDVLGFSTGLFPPVLAAGAVMGRVSVAGAAWSGLPAGIPVTVAGHDHLAGMAGAGVRRGGVANSVGTAETLVARTATLPDMATALDRRAAVTVHPGGEEWVVLVSAARAGLVLDAAAESLGRRPDELDGLAEHASPVPAAAVLDGGPLPAGDPGAVWAGLLEALAERTAEAFARLTDVLGPRREVVVFGGGSVSGPWLRAKAARLGVPVLRSTVASAVARGAAVQAGVAAGWWASADEAPTPEAVPVGAG